MRKILVVVDIQKDFVDGVLGSNEAASIVDHVVNKINEFDGEIIVTYDTHFNNYMETREGKYLPIPHCIKGTDGWQLDRNIQKALNSKKYSKIYKHEFSSTMLVKKLNGCNQFNTEITFIGLCTDICVLSNVILLKSNYPEMNIIVDASCCAGTTPEKHKAALEVMKSCQIDVIE